MTASLQALDDVHRPKDKQLSICLVCSAGGHLYQLYRLDSWWRQHRRFWVTFDKPDAHSLLRQEEVYWAAYPTTRNIVNAIRNARLAIALLLSRKPDVVVSDGGGVGVPFIYVAKLLGIPTLYIEVYDRVDLATLSGKLVYPIVDAFALQWEEQKRLYPKGVVVGPVI